MQIKFFKDRILALLIDQLIISILFSILNSIFKLEYHLGNLMFLNKVWKVNVSLILLVSLIYYLFFDLQKNGTTIGKMILKITITKIDDKNLTISERIIRSFLKVISISIFILPVVYYFVTNDTFHDKIVNSKTVKEK